jgi:hypothetical protein
MKIFGSFILILVTFFTTFKTFSFCSEFDQSVLFNADHNNLAEKLKPFRNKAKTGQHIICITIPKSGTHLLHKCLVLLNLKGVYHPEKNGVSERFIDKVRKLNKYPPPNHYKGLFHIPTVGPIPKGLVKQMQISKKARSIWSHWPYTVESEKIFNKYGKRNFFMIRDPRDQLVSMVFMVYKNHDGREVDFEDALIDLIDGRQKRYIPWAVEIQTAHPLMWELGVVKFYQLYLPWMKSKQFHTVRFEDLIGTAGEGAIDTQILEIQNIANHLGIELTFDQALEISDNLFGGTFTFRKGQIGEWKKYFTPNIKKIFKKTPGACQLLIDLGYETNNDW